MTHYVRPAPAGLFIPDTLLDALEAGIVQFRPVYAADDPAQLLDLAYISASPVAQRLLGLNGLPPLPFCALASHDRALFAFWRDTFWSGEVGYYGPGYEAAGTRWRVVAQRAGELLVVSFSALTGPGAEPILPGALARAEQAAQLADQQLMQEREVFRQVLAQTPAAICILRGPEYRFEYVNRAFGQLFAGRVLEGQPAALGLPETVHQGFIELLDRVYATGETFFGNELPMAIAQPDGRPARNYYFNFTYQAHLENGHAERLSVFAYDVTEQVLARHEREAHRAEWQHVFEQAPVAIAVLRGPRYVVELANATVCALWGRQPAQVLGRPLFEGLPQATGQGLKQLLDAVMATGEPHAAPALPILIDRHGRRDTVYWNFVYQPLHEAPDRRIGGVIVVATEMSEQIMARRQVQALNEELHATNAKLHANNDELVRAQCQLQQLTQDLETRLAAGLAEAHHARAQAERRQERLERFLAQVPAAVCILDGPELVFELANPSFQALFPGRPLLGLPVLAALPEFRGLPVLQQMQQVYATGETHEETNQLLALAPYAGGPLADFYFHYVQQARYDASGRIDGVLVFALDLTLTAQVRVQRRAEALQAEVLAEVQRRAQGRETFYQVFAQTPAAIALLWGPEYRIDYTNQACQKIFLGRDLLGLPVAEALPEIGSQGFIALLDHVYQTGETFTGIEMPLAIAQPDGQAGAVRYMNFTYQAYREHGATGGISVFAYDVTEQVLARQQREIGLAQLQTVFERAPVALALLTGPIYRIEVANPVICSFWGREQAEVLGRPLFEVLPEVVDQGFPKLLAQVWCTGEPFVAEEQPVVLLRQGQRETVYFQFVYQPLADAQGQVTAVVIVATDVSARVLQRRQLAQANAELHGINTQLLHTNMDLDNFIYTASHDLKTPIANIESLLLLLRKQLPAEVRQAGLVPRVLAMMQGAIERFQLTIAQLTDLSRLQQTRTEPAESIDLTTVVQAVWLDLAPMREATSAQLMVDVAACTRMHFAPQNLRAVVYNLLSNAIKYHHPDRAPLVQLRCRPGSSATVLEVQDNGLGLSPQQQTKLFGLFQRLHAHVEGSGVGLYMVKRIVENAGGTVAVASQPGVGSTFTVTFPAAAPARPT